MEKIGEILFLSRRDVERVLNPKDALNIIEKTFKWINDGKVNQIHAEQLNIESAEGVRGSFGFRPYPGHIKPLKAVGLKWLSGYPPNISKGLPYSMAVDILNDAETGAPIAIMDGMFVTAMRTAGHAAIGAKYLARKNSEVIAILGCGLEGRSHLRLMNELFRIKEVRVCDIAIGIAKKFCRDMEEMLNLNMRQFETVEETLEDADVICEVTTSRKPTISTEWIKSGCYIAASNILGIDPRLTVRATKWVVGNWERDLQWIEPEQDYSKNDIYASLDEIVAGKIHGRESDEEIIVLTHHGMSALDVSTMHVVYNIARKKGVGALLKLF